MREHTADDRVALERLAGAIGDVQRGLVGSMSLTSTINARSIVDGRELRSLLQALQLDIENVLAAWAESESDRTASEAC
jgi:hypothetical protein